MSAFSVGSQSSTKDKTGQVTQPDSGPASGAVVKWIPGEAITFYAALLGIGAAQGPVRGDETPEELLARIGAGSPEWFVVGAVIAAVLVLVGAVLTKPPNTKVVAKSVAARIILTLCRSSSGRQPRIMALQLDLDPRYGRRLRIASVPVGLIFCAVAQFASRRYQI